MDLKKFGAFFAQKRKESGFKSQRQLAVKSGVSNGTIARIEAGIQKPHPETLRILAKHLSATSYPELMIKAGYWNENDEDTKLMTEIYTKEKETIEKIKTLLKKITDDEGKFPAKFHKEIFEIFGTYADDSVQYEKSSFRNILDFDRWYENVYLNMAPEDISESTEAEAIEEFNKYYNYTTIKRGIENLDESIFAVTKTAEDFLKELEDFIAKHGLIAENDDDALIPEVLQVKIPILGTVAGGEPITRIENIEGYIMVEKNIIRGREAFALKVKGDSMIGDGIADGDIVIVVKQPEVLPTDIAVVAVDAEEATLKRVKCEGEMCMLIPSNPSMQPILEHASNIHIIGKVIQVRKNFE